MSLDDLIEEFYRKNNLPKYNDDHIVNDDTQVGIEFAFDRIGVVPEGKQLVSEEAIKHLHDQYPEAYKAFYDKL